MLLPLLLAALADTVTLERGALLPSYGRYVAVEDTVLDGGEGDRPQGGASALIGGVNRPVLIQFLDLDHALGRNRKVRKATLELVFTKGTPKLKSVRRMLVPWTEGPINTVAGAIRGDDLSVRWAATYRYRRGGIDAIPWQTPGGRGDAESELIPGATGVVQGDKLVVSGLEGAVQAQLDRWYDNHGFALEFDDANDFLSSSATEGRPRLTLELESTEPQKGPDLSVALISRTPEYERFDVSGQATSAEQDGAPVPLLDGVKNANTKKWPDEGETLAYKAVVRNVGDAPAQAFEAQWLDREAGQSIVTVDKALAPGEQTELTFELPYRSSHTDHRVQPVGLRVFPKGPDANKANDFLEVQQSALNLTVRVTSAAAAKIEASGWSVADWLQDGMRSWNEVACRYSRYSFAPDGVLERVRWQKIVVSDDALPEDLMADGQVVLNDPHELNVKIAEACGLVRLTAKGLAEGGTASDGTKIPAALDRYAGLMGGGDTRVDALLAPSLPFPYDVFADAMFDPSKLESGGSLSATDVFGLNRNLGRRRGYRGDYLYDAPSSILLTVTDMSGTKRLANTDVTVYPMRNGSFDGVSPIFTLKTGEQGSILLTKRPVEVPEGFFTATGHTLTANPFGRIDPNFANGALAVKATYNGATAVGVLKLWQAIDAGARARRSVALMVLRLNVPTVALGDENVAKGRPAKLTNGDAAAAVDGNPATAVSIEGWLELDLGEDRSVGEITVDSPDAEGSFDLLVYGSGEKPEAARLYAREGDLRWTRTCRPEANGSLVYRGLPQKARFIRLVPKGPMSVSELRVRFGH